MRTLIKVYRSARREGMYLYVRASDGLEGLPAELLAQFGRAEQAMILPLTPERRLARADAGAILRAIDERGYFLQLPPREEDELTAVAARNDKLGQR